MISSHYLRPNKSSAIPARFVFVDTETRAHELRPGLEEHELKIGVARFWQRAGNKQPEHDEEKVFATREDFWEWLERHITDGKRLVVFAHNAQFDLQVLGGPAMLVARGWEITKAVIDAERVIVRAQQGRRHLLWLDWFNYFRAPLERAAELVGLEYVPLPDKDASIEAWLHRCRNDVRILERAVRRWIELVERHELGYFAPTLAAQALKAYRHGFMDHEILVLKPAERPKIERRAYMGGRTEALSVGELSAGPYTLLDVNSMYAAVMRAGLYPRRLLYTRGRSSRGELAALLEHQAVIAEVELETELPIWPVHHEERLVFPVGRFTTTLTTPELKEAVRRRALRRVGELAVYEPAPLFTRWVDAIYALRLGYRQQGDALAADLLSHMLQSLYGKFGEHRRRWQKVADEPELPDEIWTERDLDAGRERVFRRLAGTVAERDDDDEGEQAMPAIPAHVTAYARLKIWRLMELAGLEHVHYVDTDALIVDQAGLDQLYPLVRLDALGALRLVEQADTCRIEGPKVYELGGERARKGIRADALRTPEGKWRQRQFLGLAAQLRRGHVGGPLVETVEIAPARGPMGTAPKPGAWVRVPRLRLPSAPGGS